MKTSEERDKYQETEKGFSEAMKEKPPSSVKDLAIGPDSGTNETALKRYIPIVEMVVKKEYKSIPSYLAEYSELINVGLLTVNKLLNEAKQSKRIYNSSYIAQAVKWAMKDELRVKYNWYGVKQVKSKDENESYYTASANADTEESSGEITVDEATERVFETILYLDDFQRETATADQLANDELAKLEFVELRNAIKKAVDKLPPKHKRVIELRFYEGKKGNDIAAWLGVTPSRVSHMIQDAIEKVRQTLALEGFG